MLTFDLSNPHVTFDPSRDRVKDAHLLRMWPRLGCPSTPMCLSSPVCRSFVTCIVVSASSWPDLLSFYSSQAMKYKAYIMQNTHFCPSLIVINQYMKYLIEYMSSVTD